MKSLVKLLFGSSVVQIMITLFSYLFNALLLGIALVPSLLILIPCFHAVHGAFSPGAIVILAIALGCSLYCYFICGSILFAVVIRIISFGIKPGTYSLQSIIMIRWLLYSGIYHLAGKTILDFVPLSFLGIWFFKIIGAKIGKNVRLNTWYLNDPYLLDIEDDVVVGGKTDISCHTFERNSLILQKIKIGEKTLIGQRCYIAPGVTIGKQSVIGQYSLIRRGKILPERSMISALAGMDLRMVAKIENGNAV